MCETDRERGYISRESVLKLHFLKIEAEERYNVHVTYIQDREREGERERDGKDGNKKGFNDDSSRCHYAIRNKCIRKKDGYNLLLS